MLAKKKLSLPLIGFQQLPGADLAANNGGRSYLEMVHKNNWTRKETEVIDDAELLKN